MKGKTIINSAWISSVVTLLNIYATIELFPILLISFLSQDRETNELALYFKYIIPITISLMLTIRTTFQLLKRVVIIYSLLKFITCIIVLYTGTILISSYIDTAINSDPIINLLLIAIVIAILIYSSFRIVSFLIITIRNNLRQRTYYSLTIKKWVIISKFLSISICLGYSICMLSYILIEHHHSKSGSIGQFSTFVALLICVCNSFYLLIKYLTKFYKTIYLQN